MAETQIVLEQTLEFGWVADKHLISVLGIWDNVNKRYYPGYTRASSFVKWYLEGQYTNEEAGLSRGSTIVEELVFHPAVPPSLNPTTHQEQLGSQAYYIYEYYERFLVRRLAKWFDVPLPRELADVPDYNQTVLALMIQGSLNVGWGTVTSTWWERLIVKHELSEETQQMAMQFVNEYVEAEATRLETENPLLFGFNKHEIGAYFGGMSARTALALIRLVQGRSIMSDYPLLEPLAGKTDIGWGLRHLMEHPKGSHYAGDFNIEDIMNEMDPAILFGMAASGMLAMAGVPLWLSGSFAAGLTTSSVIQDILNDDFTMGTIVKIAGVFLYAWGAAVQLTVVQQVVPKVVSDSVKLSVSSTAAGITADQTLASGNAGLMAKMTSVLGLVTALTGAAAYNIFTATQKGLLNSLGRMTSYLGEATGYGAMFEGRPSPYPTGLPQPSTIRNPYGAMVNPIGTQYGQPTVAPVVEETDVATPVAAIAVAAGAWMMLKG